MNGKYYLGKCDGYGSGLKSCKAFLTWRLEQRKEGLQFTMCGKVWNHIATDIIRGGQCCDDLAACFPQDKKAARMIEIWQRWHLNGLDARGKLPVEVIEEIKSW